MPAPPVFERTGDFCIDLGQQFTCKLPGDLVAKWHSTFQYHTGDPLVRKLWHRLVQHANLKIWQQSVQFKFSLVDGEKHMEASLQLRHFKRHFIQLRVPLTEWAAFSESVYLDAIAEHAKDCIPKANGAHGFSRELLYLLMRDLGGLKPLKQRVEELGNDGRYYQQMANSLAPLQNWQASLVGRSCMDICNQIWVR